MQVETIPPGLSQAGARACRATAWRSPRRRGSPAAEAGLKAATHQVTADGETVLLGGDSIVAIDGKPIRAAQDLADAVAQRKPGDHVSLTVVHGGSTRTVSLALGTSPQS